MGGATDAVKSHAVQQPEGSARESAGASELEVLRQKALTSLLRFMFLATVPVVAYLQVILAPRERWLDMAIGISSELLLGILAFSRMPYRFRATLYVVLLFSSAAAQLVLQGFSAGAIVIGGGIPIVALLFLGSRAAIVTLVGWTLMLVGVGGAMDFGVYVPPADVGGTEQFSRAILHPVLLLTVTLPTLLAARFLMNGLQATLAEKAVTADEKQQALEQLKAAQDSLVSSERLRTLGLLAGGVAHDLNNTLTVIQGEVDLLRSDTIEESRTSIIEATDSASHLTRQLLSVAGKTIMCPKVMDLRRAIRPTMKAVPRILPADIEVRPPACDQALPVSVDPAALHHALLNIVLNARDAMPDGGVLEVRLFRRGTSALLEISDNGIGMSPETVARAGQPFFTTKSAGKGTGLGLANVRRVVEHVSGSMSLSSSLGEGTTVTLAFPIAAAAESDITGDHEVLAGSGERVLVLEDDLRVRGLMVALLTDAGYDVLEAGTVAAARKLAQRDGIALLVTDLMLPDGKGSRFARELISRNRVLGALVVSGYAPDEEDREAMARGELPLLQKPFTGNALKRAVFKLLHRDEQDAEAS